MLSGELLPHGARSGPPLSRSVHRLARRRALPKTHHQAGHEAIWTCTKCSADRATDLTGPQHWRESRLAGRVPALLCSGRLTPSRQSAVFATSGHRSRRTGDRFQDSGGRYRALAMPRRQSSAADRPGRALRRRRDGADPDRSAPNRTIAFAHQESLDPPRRNDSFPVARQSEPRLIRDEHRGAETGRPFRARMRGVVAEAHRPVGRSRVPADWFGRRWPPASRRWETFSARASLDRGSAACRLLHAIPA